MKVAILARVSSTTDRQDYSRQISDLEKVAQRNDWEVVSIVKAKVSATKTRLTARQDIAELYELVNAGVIKKVLVTEVTRIARKAKEVREVVEYLENNGVSLFIESSGLDTGAKNPMQKAINNIFLTMLAEFAELETVRLKQRIKSGMAEAVKKGKIIGRPKGATDNFLEKIKQNEKYQVVVKKIRKGGLSLREIAAITNVSVNTVRKIQKALN